MKCLRFAMIAATLIVCSSIIASEFVVADNDPVPCCGQQQFIQAKQKAKTVKSPTGKIHFTGRVAPSKAKFKEMLSQAFARHGIIVAKLPKATAPTYDCRTLGYVGHVQNQGNCGSCWCFSGTDVCTSAMYKAGVLKNDGTTANYLCQQYSLDCAQNGGCNGDDNTSITTWCKATGLPTQATYGPYTASSGRCSYTSSMTLYKIADWGFCTPSASDGVAATQDIKNAMVAYGPIGAGIDASGLGDGQGIISGTGHSIDHDIVLVGWDDSKGTKGCWILRNSWDTTWGQTCGGTEAGYCYIEYGAWDVGTEAIWAVATSVTPPTPPGPPPPWLMHTGAVETPFDTLRSIRDMIDADASATLSKVYQKMMQQKQLQK